MKILVLSEEQLALKIKQIVDKCVSDGTTYWDSYIEFLAKQVLGITASRLKRELLKGGMRPMIHPQKMIGRRFIAQDDFGAVDMSNSYRIVRIVRMRIVRPIGGFNRVYEVKTFAGEFREEYVPADWHNDVKFLDPVK